MCIEIIFSYLRLSICYILDKDRDIFISVFVVINRGKETFNCSWINILKAEKRYTELIAKYIHNCRGKYIDRRSLGNGLQLSNYDHYNSTDSK